MDWYNRQTPHDEGRDNPWKALKSLMNGSLSAKAIPTLFKDPRFTKDLDPMYGIVAAYLYDRLGDIDAIRRLCIYYERQGQAVPFDIALLARIPFEVENGMGFLAQVPEIPEDVTARATNLPEFARTAQKSATVRVSGAVPTLTSGWGRLNSISRDPRITQFGEFAELLQGTPIACFHGSDNGRRLVDAISNTFQL